MSTPEPPVERRAHRLPRLLVLVLSLVVFVAMILTVGALLLGIVP